MSSDSGSPWLTAMKCVAVVAAIKGLSQLYHLYQLTLADRSVQDLKRAHQVQPKLITSGPRAIQILDETGITNRVKLVAPSDRGPAPSTTIRILSVTSRSKKPWIKEEDPSGRYAVERNSGKVHLFIQPRWALSPSLNPACTELEGYLRLHKIPYSVHIVNVLRGVPSALGAAAVEDVPQESKTEAQRVAGEKGRQAKRTQSIRRPLPFIVYKGEVVVGNFTHLTRYLEEKFNLPSPEEAADKTSWAVAQALTRTLEFSLHLEYNVGMLFDSPGLFSQYAGEAMGVPWWAMRLWVSLPFFSKLRRDVQHSLKFHDLGQLTREQRNTAFLQQLKSLESFLAEREHPFLFGTTPTKEDCTLLAYLMPIVRLPLSDLERSGNTNFIFIAQSEVFRRYVDDMTAALFPDFDRMIGHLLGSRAVASSIARQQGELLRQKAMQRNRRNARRRDVGRTSLNSTLNEVRVEPTPSPAPAPVPVPSTTNATTTPPPTTQNAAASTVDPLKEKEKEKEKEKTPTPTPAPSSPPPEQEQAPPVRRSSTVQEVETFNTLSASAIRKTRPNTRGRSAPAGGSRRPTIDSTATNTAEPSPVPEETSNSSPTGNAVASDTPPTITHRRPTTPRRPSSSGPTTTTTAAPTAAAAAAPNNNTTTSKGSSGPNSLNNTVGSTSVDTPQGKRTRKKTVKRSS